VVIVRTIDVTLSKIAPEGDRSEVRRVVGLRRKTIQPVEKVKACTSLGGKLILNSLDIRDPLDV
jgi:hypothetical protein